MDFISGAKNIGSSAFGSSSSATTSSGASGSGSGGSGLFSNFFSLSIQKMVLILAVIAFIISVGTVAILLWKSKTSQQWPPEIAKCPDRMELNSSGQCVDKYGLLASSSTFTPDPNHCANFTKIQQISYAGNNEEGSYIPWEGIVDGKASRASSLKCAI